MNEQERIDLDRIYEATTPGLWSTAHGFDRSHGADTWFIYSESDSSDVLCNVTPHVRRGVGARQDSEAEANAEFVAMAHNTLPGLLADSERAEALGIALRRLLDYIEDDEVGVWGFRCREMTLDDPEFVALLTEARAALGQ